MLRDEIEHGLASKAVFEEDFTMIKVTSVVWCPQRPGCF